jgi:hypothetical protein
MLNRKVILSLAALVFLAGMAVLLLSTGDNGNDLLPMSGHTNTVQRLDLSSYTDAPPAKPLRLLFIHHSCGGQLFAAPGTDNGTNCVYSSHPNGGGLRSRLEKSFYEVHEASYGSRVGQKTDIFDWPLKFRDQMEQILSCDNQDASYTDGRRNQIVVFKSCFPNNDFVSAGTPPGNPAGPELTVWNAKAAYAALLDEFRKHPDALFVCFTAPPLAPRTTPQPLWKRLAKKILGRDSRVTKGAALAREFNNWLSGKDGWLNSCSLTNVVVFDYYDILTGNGASNLSLYPTGDGCDSHPNREGNEKAAEAFVPMINRAVRRAGLAQ